MKCGRCDQSLYESDWRTYGDENYCLECVLGAWESEARSWAREAGADDDVVNREFEKRLTHEDYR